MIPVTIAGLLFSRDAERWIRGRLELFDPVGVIAVLGLHFFYLAPILHVHFDYWLPYIEPPDDWRPWLGAMATLNILSLIAYKGGLALVLRTSSGPSPRKQLDKTRFIFSVATTLTLAALLQLWVYRRVGGVLAYMEGAAHRESGEGMGWIFMISESVPILAMLILVVVLRQRQCRVSRFHVLILMAGFVGLCLPFGGLRGSRATTVWAVFWAAGLVHLWLARSSAAMCSLDSLV